MAILEDLTNYFSTPDEQAQVNSRNAMRRAQNLMSPGYAQLEEDATFKPMSIVTTADLDPQGYIPSHLRGRPQTQQAELFPLQAQQPIEARQLSLEQQKTIRDYKQPLYEVPPADMIREDGTLKSDQGFLGPQIGKDGSTMTEYSVGIHIGGKETAVPSLVPTLDKEEIDFLKTMPNPKDIPEKTMRKIRDFATKRIDKGLSPFFQKGERLIPSEKAMFERMTRINEGVNLDKSIGMSPDKLIKSVFKAEGGYSDDPKDTGNYYNDKFIGTNHGISAPILAEYLKREPTVEDMKALTTEQANEIYKVNYYDKYGIGELPNDVQEIAFHGVVNSGSHAIKVIQTLLGLEADGKLGPKTIEAMKTAKFTKKEFKDALLEKYKTFSTWDTHGKGWTKRFENLAK